MRTTVIWPFLCFIVAACSSGLSHKADTSIPFTEWNGVTLVDSIGVFQYKDTLYYVNEPSEFIFKIPEGFTAHRGSNWDVDGMHLLNADSTIRIDLTAIDRGIAPYGGETITHEDVLANIACDNGDVRMYYECNDTGFLKVGFTEECMPLLEKANAIFDDADGMINAHVHIVRMTYQDSVAKQAFNINWDYIAPWPKNIYK